MEVISIHDAIVRDMGSVLSFDLIDILRLFEARVLESNWKVSGVEAYPLASHGLEEWEPFAKGIHSLSGTELMRLASVTFQTIDGYFWGYLPGKSQFWLMIRAVDGCFFLVASPLPEVIGLLKSHFRDVRTKGAEEVWNPD